MKKYFGQIASSYLILQKGNKVLLARRINTGYHDGEYSLVAGHVEGNETAREALVREGLEESGIKVRLKDLKLLHMMHRPSDTIAGDRRIDFFWVLKTEKASPKLMSRTSVMK